MSSVGRLKPGFDPPGWPGALAPRRVTAVVFDMDGTLLDSSSTVPAAYAAAILELCGREPTTDQIIAAYSAGPAAALMARFTGRASTEADVECWHRHLEARLHLTKVYDGVADAVAALKREGFRLGVFTGATRRGAHAQLQHCGLARAFDVVVGSDEIDRVKPAPDGLLLAADRLGVPVRQLAYVGDAVNDLRCADAAGALPVAAGWGHLYEADDTPHVLADSPLALVTLLRSVVKA